MTRSRTARLVAVAALLSAATACSDSTTPYSPTAPPPPPVAPAGPPAVVSSGFPALERAGDIYAEVGAPYSYPASLQFHGGSIVSRLVLYRDRRFELQFSSARFGFFAYGGSYVRTGASIDFSWDGWSTAGPWGATGTVHDAVVHLGYNQVMQLTDFVDGDYALVPGTP